MTQEHGSARGELASYLLLTLLLAGWASSPLRAEAEAGSMLKGGVRLEHRLPGEKPEDRPGEDGALADPFSQGGDPFTGGQESLAAGEPFELSAEQTGFAGEPGSPAHAPLPQEQTRPQPENPQAQDPDETPEMRLLWDQWHRRVAAEVFQRYNFFAKAAFRYSRPLLARVNYVATREGEIKNVVLVEGSPNLLFNILVVKVVQSLSGNSAILEFPPGSRRAFVIKQGTFMQNFGQSGFRYTMGDAERIPGR